MGPLFSGESVKVAIAIDSFKGSLNSIETGTAALSGVKRAFPDAVCEVRPLADGGEGTVGALVAGLGGEQQSVTVTGPTGKPTAAANLTASVEQAFRLLESGQRVGL